MYLEKLEIQGFKSFAHKTILTFPAADKAKAGITAIVGPNGSGKSNIADAVRWVLGEQSLKTLRGKKSEDVIFSGSSKKARLGAAEAVLHLNNEDKKVLPEYGQIAVARRLFRDGTSEYLINNSRVRLADVQILLAQANFGQRTYSVIGQGMVDAVLAASDWERKEFFDEATGVKQYQIKREQAAGKLAATEANLAQGRALLKEITPRLRQLERAVKKLEAREKTEAKLQELQFRHYGHLWTATKALLDKLTRERATMAAKHQTLAKEAGELQMRLSRLEKEQSRAGALEDLHLQYQKALNKKSELGSEVKSLERELELAKKEAAHSDSSVNATALIQSAEEQLAFLEKILMAKNETEWKKLQSEAKRLQARLLAVLKKGEAPGKDKTDAAATLMQKIGKTKEALLEAQNEVKAVETKLAENRERERQATGAVFSLQKELQGKQAALSHTANQKNQLEIELARSETRHEDLEQELKRELAPAENERVKKEGREEKEAPDLWPEISRAKHELEMIGGMDPTTLSEYDETRQRHEFLSRQCADLEAGLAKTKEALKALDAIISREFDSAFAKINRGFGEYFTLLFDGGKASLELKQENELESLSEEAAAGLTEEEREKLARAFKIGIGIKASPPGKRVASINMLSGGERALTSLALICAIIKANPSPFVVLDEVDAALDEANSVRFAVILEKLSHHTQFITITHNRATMERAGILYGVTMGEDGVSKLLSVDLEKAVQTTKR